MSLTRRSIHWPRSWGPCSARLGALEAAVWLRQNLGAAFQKTLIGAITVATYTGPADDASRLYVEVADEGYLRASPAPSR